MRGGMMYGYGFDPLTGTGGAGYTAVDTSAPFSSKTGAAIPDPFRTDPTTQAGGRRRKSKKGGKKSKKSKKGGKKTRKTRKHRMRGGAGVYNAGATGTSFVGGISEFPTGSQTYGSYQGYNPQIPATNPHPVGADGVTRV
jgi:hypothetical protein